MLRWTSFVVRGAAGLSAWRETILSHWEEALDERTFKDFMRDTLHKDCRPLLPGVRLPTLVIAAEQDANQVEHVRYLAEHIEGARFALIRDASHFATFTAAETYRTIVSTFLATGDLPKQEWSP